MARIGLASNFSKIDDFKNCLLALVLLKTLILKIYDLQDISKFEKT
jgi:hypothetical protein